MRRSAAAVVQPVSVSGGCAVAVFLRGDAAGERRGAAVLSLRRRRRQMRRYSTKFAADLFATAAAAPVVYRPDVSLCAESRLQVRLGTTLVAKQRLSHFPFLFNPRYVGIVLYLLSCITLCSSHPQSLEQLFVVGRRCCAVDVYYLHVCLSKYSIVSYPRSKSL